MKVIAFGALLGLIFVMGGPALTQPTTVTWPEAIAQLAGTRAKAETCVALLKKYGDQTQIARSQLLYVEAKASVDAVVAGLITALSSGQTPESLPSLQSKLSKG